jgi:hypothetical protein
MAYVKISDPKIIDLPTMHQIIQVVNQHSDNISALTNNYGNIYSGATTSGTSTEYIYDVASQQIIYGQTSFNTTNGNTTYNGTNFDYTASVSFIGQPFSSTPFIVTQPLVTSSGTGYQDIIANITGSTVAGFNIVLRRANNKTNWLTGTVNVNWIAIGHK